MAGSPAPGQMNPSRYPIATGPKYAHYGEQQGWIYDPYSDSYKPDPKVAKPYYEETGLIDKAPKQPGLGEQLLPLGATAAVITGAGAIGKDIINGDAVTGLSRGIDTILGGGGAPIPPATNPGMMGGGGVAGGAQTAAPGVASPSVVGGSQVANPGMMAAAEPTGFSAGGAASNFASMGIGPQAGIAAGALATAKGAKDLMAGKEGLDSWEGAAGRAQLALSTFGFSEVARLAGMGRKSTADYRKERWNKAIGGAATEQDKEAFEGFRELAEQGAEQQTFKSGPLAGRKWDWNEVKGLAKGEDVWAANGFMEAFPDWTTNYSEDERRQISQAALDNNLLTSDNGSLIFSSKHGDLGRIKEIGQQIKDGTYVPPISDEERELGRQQFAESIGVEYTPLSITAASQDSQQPDEEERPLDTSGGANDPGRNPGMMKI